MEGFTLIELMLVVGLISVIALGITEFLTYQLRSSRTVQNASELGALEQQLSALLNREDACSATLMDLRAGDPVRFIRNGDGTVLYDTANGTNQVFPLTEFVVQSMRLLSSTEMAAETPTVAVSVSTMGAATLVLRVDALHRSAIAGGAPAIHGPAAKTFYQRVNVSLSAPLHVRIAPATTPERAMEICTTFFPGAGTPLTTTTVPEMSGTTAQNLDEEARLAGVIPAASTHQSVSSFSSYEEVPGGFDPVFGPFKSLFCNFSSFDVRIAKCLGTLQNDL